MASHPTANGPHSYRADVDGLRAIAILSVVAYHASEPMLPGGFTGVDVFFVISGYLITRLIAADITRGQFSIARFYVRRTKRIFPALFVVLLGTLLLSLLVLTPGDLSALGSTTAATATFYSNILFWQDTGYFDTVAERKPLLHTWSLAVEEQFYVLWPLTLFLLSKTRLRVGYVITGIIAVSFAGACYLVVRHQPSAFFLLPPRAWELLLGAALAVAAVPSPKRRVFRDLSAVIGLAMIAVGVGFLDSTSAFPGWSALWPCVGTALLISAGEHGDNVVARQLLSRRPMVFVGLISYSLYLWHWPLLSLARITQRGTLTPAQALVVIGIATGLSVLTWRFVEQPLRAKRSTPAPAPVLIRYALVSVVAFVVGAYVRAERGFVDFAGPEIVRTERARYDGNPLSGNCLRWQGETGPLPGDPCISGKSDFAKRLVLWGDSHADAAAPGVVRYAAGRDYATEQLTMAACPPLVGIEVEGPDVDYQPCADFNDAVLRHITTAPDVEAVMLVARWTVYTENARFGRDDPGPITYLVDASDRAHTSEASKRVFTRALDRTIRTLRDAGKAVMVLGTIPPLGVNIPECLARNHMPFSGVRECSVPAGAVLPHLQFADSQIEHLTHNRPGVCAYLPKKALCRGGRCLDTAGGDILYANDDHVTSRGAIYLSQFFEFDGCLADSSARRSARR